MNRKIPPEAFSLYLGMGPGRSYQAVADRYGASKRAVVAKAKREGWQEKVAEVERKSREKAETQAGHTLEEMNDRHLKTAQLIQKKALEALARVPIEEAMDAVRALKIGLEHERLIRGEPTERNAVSVEEIIKREYERWLIRGEEPGEPGGEGEGGNGG